MSPTVLPLVEGHSEVRSVPLLVRCLLAESGVTGIQVARPHRVHRTKVVLEGELERALEMSLRYRTDVAGVLVLLDADDDDPEAVETTLQARCRAAHAIPSRVVLARRELEAWLLGGKESLRGVRGIHDDAIAPDDPEGIRGAKERLSHNFAHGTYVEVDDQPALFARLDLVLTSERCPSFQRFRRAVVELAGEILTVGS